MAIFGGIDSGHQSINAVLVDEEKIVGSCSLVTGDEAAEGSRNALKVAIGESKYSVEDLACLVATGAGKERVELAKRTMSDALCHAAGAHYLHPSVRTVIDMGAEGFRVLKLDERGLVRKFVQNDMCASGSGTFIDEMSAALEVTVEEAWRMSMGAQRTEKISSLCVVFGESEVISAVHRGIPKDEILAGIHEAITERIGTLVRGIRPEQDIVATGGVARNPCIVKMLGKKLGVPVVVTEAPHLVGALGAALLARDLFSRA